METMQRKGDARTCSNNDVHRLPCDLVIVHELFMPSTCRAETVTITDPLRDLGSIFPTETRPWQGGRRLNGKPEAHHRIR